MTDQICFTPWGQEFWPFLAPRDMRIPAISVLHLVYISKHALERSPRQIEIDHIGKGERVLGEGRVA